MIRELLRRELADIEYALRVKREEIAKLDARRARLIERLRLPIVYYSLTGNVRRFVEKTGRRAYQIPEIVAEPYILVTPTTGFGEIPEPVTEYLREYGGLLRAVAVSGNRNWGANYGAAGVKIAEEYGVPLILRFELAGNDDDIRKFNEEAANVDNESYRT